MACLRGSYMVTPKRCRIVQTSLQLHEDFRTDVDTTISVSQAILLLCSTAD